MKGTIIKVRGSLRPHSFEIKGEDDKTYFAHLVDIFANEQLLYSLDETTVLKENDSVEFNPIEPTEHNTTHAVNVKKVD